MHVDGYQFLITNQKLQQIKINNIIEVSNVQMLNRSKPRKSKIQRERNEMGSPLKNPNSSDLLSSSRAMENLYRVIDGGRKMEDRGEHGRKMRR